MDTLDHQQGERCVSIVCSSDHRPFRIFKLPVELRDQIYDEALVDVSTFTITPKKNDSSDTNGDSAQNTTRPEGMLDEILEGGPNPKPQDLHASVKFRPNTNMLLGSRRLKQEYEARAKKFLTLVLKDNDRYSFQVFTLPEPAQKAYYAELHLILFCHLGSMHPHGDNMTCQASYETSQHRDWIEDLLEQLPNLRSFSIHAYLCYDKYDSAKKEKFPCEGIVKRKIDQLFDLPKLEELVLYRYDFQAKPDLDGPKVPILKWSSDGEVKVVETPTQDAETEKKDEGG